MQVQRISQRHADPVGDHVVAAQQNFPEAVIHAVLGFNPFPTIRLQRSSASVLRRSVESTAQSIRSGCRGHSVKATRV
jgi:hypothetical protein